MALLEEIQTGLQQAARQPGDAVVGLGRGWGVGSGFVFAPGRVLTSAHNLRHDEVTVSFSDGRTETGRVAGSDARPGRGRDRGRHRRDRAGRLARAGRTAPEIGQAVFALGNPGGRGLRVTPGFISSAARSFRGPRGRRITGAIEHTAPLPRGSSGGPVIAASGGLLGINSVRVDGGLILAVPADATLRERVEGLARGEAPQRVRLGVAVAPPRVARRLRRAVGLPERDGVLVRAVEEGSAADRAGLQRGDLIVQAAWASAGSRGRPLRGARWRARTGTA